MMYLERGNSNVNNENFTQQVIVPFFIGMVDKNIISTVYDLDGNILVITNLHAKLWGYRHYKEMVGKSLSELIKCDKFAARIAKLDQIRQEVITKEKMITYINFFPYNDSIAMLLCYHFPVFAPDGTVIATRILAEQTSMFNHSIEIHHQFKNDSTSQSNKIILSPDKIKLTTREEEILYLLKIGLSQEEVAYYLGISRGTVIKTISNKLCPQFGIEGINTNLLIKKVIKSKYFDHIPTTLLRPKIIVIENDFESMID